MIKEVSLIYIVPGCRKVFIEVLELQRVYVRYDYSFMLAYLSHAEYLFTTHSCKFFNPFI